MVFNWNDERVRRRMLAVPILYFIFYMICFVLLESYVRPRYWIASDLDAYIPFCAAFLIPVSYTHLGGISPGRPGGRRAVWGPRPCRPGG